MVNDNKRYNLPCDLWDISVDDVFTRFHPVDPDEWEEQCSDNFEVELTRVDWFATSAT